MNLRSKFRKVTKRVKDSLSPWQEMTFNTEKLLVQQKNIIPGQDYPTLVWTGFIDSKLVEVHLITEWWGSQFKFTVGSTTKRFDAERYFSVEGFQRMFKEVDSLQVKDSNFYTNSIPTWTEISKSVSRSFRALPNNVLETVWSGQVDGFDTTISLEKTSRGTLISLQVGLKEIMNVFQGNLKVSDLVNFFQEEFYNLTTNLRIKDINYRRLSRSQRPRNSRRVRDKQTVWQIMEEELEFLSEDDSLSDGHILYQGDINGNFTEVAASFEESDDYDDFLVTVEFSVEGYPTKTYTDEGFTAADFSRMYGEVVGERRRGIRDSNSYHTQNFINSLAFWDFIEGEARDVLISNSLFFLNAIVSGVKLQISFTLNNDIVEVTLREVGKRAPLVIKEWLNFSESWKHILKNMFDRNFTN
jgi:hypothetical protein